MKKENGIKNQQRFKMFLRDQFAMAALNGALAGESEETGVFKSPHNAAVYAYQVADAMLKVREGRRTR